MSGRFKASVGNSVEPTPHSLKIVNIVMWYDCIRKLKGHACMTMRKGKVFLSRMQKQTEQDNPCLWFPLFLLPQEPGRYILATLPGLVNGGIYSTLNIRKRCLHVLIEYESLECAAIALSWPRHLCGCLIHSCENWLAFGMEVLFWCVLLSLSCFSFFLELLNSGGSRRYIFVEFAKRKVEDYGRAIRSGRAPASTWIEVLQHWSEWFGGAGSAFKRGV